MRGTVRNKNNAEKIDPLRKAFGGELFGQVELVEADLLDSDSLLRAVQGSTYVIHVASPVPFSEPQDPVAEVIRPAVDGTLAVLEACRKSGVRRVSITSSISAIYNVNSEDKPEVFDERSWSNPDLHHLGSYEKSKTLAERAAWDYISRLPDD